MIAVAVIVFIIYVGIAIGAVPSLRMNRATIALVGAGVLLLGGFIGEEEALLSLDMGTIILLGAMMIINVNIELSGFYDVVITRTLKFAHHPAVLLALIMSTAGIFSAILMNDPVCLMMTPLVVKVTQHLKRNPIPYLVALSIGSNMGSVATITGNPQNLIIGQSSGISFLDFFINLGPLALICLVISWGMIVLLEPKEFRGRLEPLHLPEPIPFKPLLWRVTVVVVLLIIALFAGAPIVIATAIAASALLISRIHPHKLLDIDWDLLAFFTGLFVITGTIEEVGLSALMVEAAGPILNTSLPAFALVTAILSNLVSNVPAVLLLRPQVPFLTDPTTGWLTLSAVSSISGNLTLLGSLNTLIIAEIAKKYGVELKFIPYLKYGVPITLLTTALSVVYIMLIR